MSYPGGATLHDPVVKRIELQMIGPYLGVVAAAPLTAQSSSDNVSGSADRGGRESEILPILQSCVDIPVMT
ncbi:uncharacterized protein N7515_010130 [Penicillium bovifimosum]|uniref:Uncharacterized protein n=1 Tax=Penicillium bovifimosum TaxID=126998 RepID=A0A9W9KUT3_9EURO|nr:uncharacterized protein N7515_010130 [Penicillium bovifimosum]KAJ5120742.1 hypothetical protein N7515_010130 [Penicillium bovifimosum]